MDLLVLGGTVFLGRHVVQEALARGHRVTLFHRGRHPLEPGVLEQAVAPGARLDTLHGDRRDGLAALAERRWDAVFDTSGYTPSDVALAADVLGSRIGHYTFVSSISVYADFSRAGMTEDAAVSPLTDAERLEGEALDRENPDQRPRFYELYGPLKAACELELERRLPSRALIVRPGLIVGPYDPTDRFTYWPERAARGGDALAPGLPSRPVQFVDARDLAVWMVALAESGRTGTYHATGPDQSMAMGTLLETCATVAGQATRWVWCDDEFLLEAGVGPWMELPLWLPERDASMHGFMRSDCRRAIESGLAFRPLEATVRDTLAWGQSRPAAAPRSAGLDPVRERELLERWRAPRSAVDPSRAAADRMR